ncbi:hypothetical protein D9M69_664860 [compost metagenome]
MDAVEIEASHGRLYRPSTGVVMAHPGVLPEVGGFAVVTRLARFVAPMPNVNIA